MIDREMLEERAKAFCDALPDALREDVEHLRKGLVPEGEQKLPYAHMLVVLISLPRADEMSYQASGVHLTPALLRRARRLAEEELTEE